MTIELAYELYTSPATFNNLDTILSNLKLTHKDFRQHLKANNITLPELTRGLAEEVDNVIGMTKKQVCQAYHLTYKEYDKIRTGDLDYRGTKLSAKDLASITTARRQGRSVADIAMEYDVSPGRIYQETSHINLSERKSRTSVKMNIKLDMAKQRRRGVSVADLAKQYNLTPNTVYVYLRDVGSISLNDN